MQPVFHCQDNLEKKACGQLLPQPQEGLTSPILSRHPACVKALYVTASSGSGEWLRLLEIFDMAEMIERKHKTLILWNSCVFATLSFPV